MIDCKFCKADCIFRGEKELKPECRGYIPMTNADRIRAMSDKELADRGVHTVKVWNRTQGYHEIFYRCSDGYTTDIYEFAISHEMEWLQQPAKEDA